MKLTTGVTLLLISAVDNEIHIYIYIYIYIFMSQVLTMKLTESTNICYISSRAVRKIRRNIKETFPKNNGFARI